MAQQQRVPGGEQQTGLMRRYLRGTLFIAGSFALLAAVLMLTR